MKFKVPPHSSIPYTWDEPHGDHRIEVQISSEYRQFNLDKVKKYPPPEVHIRNTPPHSQDRKVNYKAQVFVEGVTRVLQVAHLVEVKATEEDKSGDTAEIQVLLEIEGLSISVIDDRPQVSVPWALPLIMKELVYVSLDKISIDYIQKKLSWSVEVIVRSMQVCGYVLGVTDK
jgi:hypothetical protein